MRGSFDFTPYRRSTVGFDRLFEMLETGGAAASDSYPPFDIIKTGDDGYQISIAAAGFRPDEIEVVAERNRLNVVGRKAEAEAGPEYLHRGIATRSFERRFQLADFVEVRSASFDHGLLNIRLERVVPDNMKPRRIAVATGPAEAPALVDRAAA